MTIRSIFQKIPVPRLIALGAVGIAVLAAVVLIMTQGPKGVVTLTVPEARSDVFIDDRRLATTAEDDQTLSFKLSPGEHGIIIARAGYWPWFKNINMLADANLAFTSFSVPEDSNPAVMPDTHNDFKRITDAIKKVTPPTRAEPRLSSDNNLALWINPDNNGVYAEWRGAEADQPAMFCEIELCDPILHFFSATTPVRNVAFMNGRSDVALIATGNSIYLIELLRSPAKNFQPLYVGNNPQFTVRDENSIYIHDNNKLMVVTF